MIDSRALLMLPIAMAASVFVLWLAWREGWTMRPAGRIAAGFVCYVILLIAYLPPVAQGYQVITMLAGLAVAAAMFTASWATGGKPAPALRRVQGPAQAPESQAAPADTVYGFGFDFTEDNEDGDDWIIEPASAAAEPVEVDGLIYGYAAGGGAGRLHQPQRDGNREGAGADGSGALREPGSAGASAGAAAQASAAAAEAQARADAQTAMAQANAQVRVVEAQEETQRETAWLSILPWLALIIIPCGGAVGAGWLVLWFRGRAHLVTVQAQAQTAMMLPPPPQWPVLPAQRSPAVALLPGPVARAAERTGLTPRPAAGGIWLLVDAQGEEVYRVRQGG